MLPSLLLPQKVLGLVGLRVNLKPIVRFSVKVLIICSARRVFYPTFDPMSSFQRIHLVGKGEECRYAYELQCRRQSNHFIFLLNLYGQSNQPSTNLKSRW